MDIIQYDVVVAGTGPSGCAAAIALKQEGINVCLVDREYKGGRKVGESIPGASIRLLNRLGISGIGSILNEGDYKQCLANASSWGSEEWVYQSGMQNPEGGGYHINRAIFDKALLERAVSLGVPVYKDMIDKVSPIANEADSGFIIGFKYNVQKIIHTKWIVDATGRKAAIGRKLGLKRERIDDQMAAVNWICVPETDIDHATRIKSVPEGWWYTSLLPDNSRVIGFQSLPETVAQLHRSQDLFFDKINESGILPYKINSQSSLQKLAVEAGVAKAESVTANGLICVGDAALSFDPLSSQGIFFALYSGIKGSETIIQCLTTKKAQEALTNYQSIVDKIFIENQKSRRYFYTSEFRYYNEPYWQSRK